MSAAYILRPILQAIIKNIIIIVIIIAKLRIFNVIGLQYIRAIETLTIFHSVSFRRDRNQTPTQYIVV